MPPVRFGLPWWMPHYRPLNGAHPLALGFLDGNPAIEPVRLGELSALPPQRLDGLLGRIARQARHLDEAQAGKLIEWLNFHDQLAMESSAGRCDLLMLHTTPLYAGSQPWIFHFESLPTLFVPFLFHGECRGVDLRAQPWFALVREALESPNCLAVISHLKDSLRILNEVFRSPVIAAKCHRVPLGLPPPSGGDPLAKFAGGPLRILFTNSLHHHPRSFYLRGGHHLLEAFARLRREHPDAQLTVLSSVPDDLGRRFGPAHLQGVTWLRERVDDATLEQLFLSHHVFALPAAGLHTGSLLRALSHGCVPLVPDAPGYDEYTAPIADSVLTLRGVRALVYRDEPGGWISDRYDEYEQPREDFAAGVHALLRAHAALPRLAEMAARNLAHSREHLTLNHVHRGLNRVLAHVRPGAEMGPNAPALPALPAVANADDGPRSAPSASSERQDMRICIYTGNHGNSIGITDLVGLLRNGLRDCGLDPVVSHELMPGHCNILIEHFVEEAHLRHVLESKTPGTRYILVATELLTGGTFNHGLVQQHWHYGNHDYWKLRYDGFMVAARLSEAIWVLGETAIAPYQAALPDKPVRFLPHGWVSGSDLVQHRPEAEKDIDFYFSGTMTEYRRGILAELGRQHKVIYSAQSTPDYLRLDQLARTKVCLSIPLSPENTLPSISRMHFHLQNRNFLVHQAHADRCRLDPYVMHAPAEEFVEWARAALDVPNRREIADGVLRRFRTELPLAPWMQPLLEEVLGPAARAHAEPLRQVA
ncbi:hypothetical protein [Piscinibacter defluvii]|uniref:hypothetical protein n=1 Tax=Piscinibacter defluvii TaxID=1796922 RepID=UPI000FDE3F21|nr:hypothetical protein [Piscinibacter defluvii]